MRARITLDQVVRSNQACLTRQLICLIVLEIGRFSVIDFIRIIDSLTVCFLALPQAISLIDIGTWISFVIKASVKFECAPSSSGACLNITSSIFVLTVFSFFDFGVH